jgi:predicted alpha/beta hydrolase family esterase
VHSVARHADGVAGVLLVAPADPDKFNVSALLPQQPLALPSIMVGSTNDPWMAAPRAALWAQRWGSRFINGGPLGHINAESGLGDWPEGLETLYFLAEQAHNSALSA